MSTTEITPATAQPAADKSKRRKAKAILAGGLVLGIGAAVTLAAWNDSEFATGIFGSGHFDIEGSVDGSDSSFDDHPETAPATLVAQGDFPSLTPGAKVAMPYVLRLDKDTDYDATVSVSSSATLTGTSTNEFSYGIVKVTSAAACNATTPGQSTVVGPNTAFGDSKASAFTLNRSTNIGTDPGTPVFLCIQMTASNNLKQDTTLVATWEFAAALVS
ncbi:SipW-dependent-type signal peptide-containing protein [Arthrobacter sp. NPDC057013]|uniref:SipW-dependent-type signal peptide-containing protein n=1 Tax=Arthrobacter sp. NPDC057013 TaxID=3345999 RepID=UPI003644C295